MKSLHTNERMSMTEKEKIASLIWEKRCERHAVEAYALVRELLIFIGDMGLEHSLRTADLSLMRRARAYLTAVEGRDDK